MAAIQSRGALDAARSWFIPWTELGNLDNVDKPDYGNLRKVDSEILDTDHFIKEGDPFTITLESHFIQEARDRDNKNDLLVRSFVRYGDEPKIETFHFFKRDLASGTFEDNLEHEHIFARREFSKESRIWLSLEIIEIDRGLDRDNDLSGALSQMQGKFGAVFPALIPFAPVAGIATRLIDKISKLKSTAAENQTVLHNQIDLYAQDLAGGDAPLRCGAYVLFDEEVPGIQYRLGAGFKLKRRALADKNQPILHNYAVIQIAPGFISSGKSADELLKNQQIATVISELDEEGVDESKRTAHFSFMENLVEESRQFKDLLYYSKMMSKVQFGDTLTPSQREKLSEIKAKLGHLLPR